MSDRHVVVTTDHERRGVFAGVLETHDPQAQTVVLRDARQCIKWGAATRGVFGLASIGPQDGSRIGPKVPRLELNGVTAVADMSSEAVAVWESEPWS